MNLRIGFLDYLKAGLMGFIMSLLFLPSNGFTQESSCEKWSIKTMHNSNVVIEKANVYLGDLVSLQGLSLIHI